MKHLKKLLALLLALTLVCGLLPAAFAAPDAPAAEGDVAINATNFPDPIFRSYVSTEFDTNANGSLSESEIYVATTASLTGKGISDLKGVEYLTSLITLNCGGNYLTSIDVSKNTHLKTLSLDHNNLTTLDVSGHHDLKTLRIYANPELTTVECQNCALTGLGTDDLPALTTLDCYNNQLTSLDVSQNTALRELRCQNNQLTSLNVSQNTALTYLSCFWNQISSLDLSMVPALKDAVENGTKDTSNSGWDKYSSSQGILYVDKTVTINTDLGIEINATNFPDPIFRGCVSENFDTNANGYLSASEITAATTASLTGKGISDLKGVEYLTSLITLNCGSNNLTGIDVSQNTHLKTLSLDHNNLTTLDVSGHPDLKTLRIYSNPELTTVQCQNCALTGLGTNELPALTTLHCYNNAITSLDLSQNTALRDLACDNNQLPSLDVSKNTALAYLYCYGNQLTSLDLSKNTALTYLSCSDNQLTSLNLSQNTALTYLSCFGNQLTSLDLSKNTALTGLYCYGNQLTSLDLSMVPALQDAVENGTKDTSDSRWDKYSSSQGELYVDKTVTIITDTPGLGIAINATNFPDANFRTVVKQYDTNNNGYLSPAELAAVTEIDCSSKSIANLKGVEHFTALSVLSCYTNQLTSLDLSKNTALTELDCGYNSLASLDVSKNTALTMLDCHSNQLTSLDLSQNTALTRLDCGYNSLASLDVSKNTALTYLSCIRNHLTSLDLRPVPALNYTVGLYRWKELPPEIPSGFDYVYYQGSQGVLYVDPDVELLVNINPFTDVKEGKFYYEPVLWAYYSDPQVTAGTDATHFSPTKTCTRGQVVTFLWRANGCPEPTLTENPFTDVKKSAFYYKAVLWAVENGVTTGTSATTFGPNNPCTRAQVVTFLWRAEGSPAPTTTTCPFTDVKTSGFYYEAMLWAVENGVTTGTSATTFGPGKPCTRGQVVSFLQRTVEN